MLTQGKSPPELNVDWIQGKPINSLRELQGNWVLIHLFHMNCPYSFGASLPNVHEMNEIYGSKGWK